MRIKAMEFEKDYQKGLSVCKLTENELNNLLEESYNEGYRDGYKDAVTTKLPYKDKDRWEVSYVREESTTVPNTTLKVSTSPAVITQINNDIGHGTITAISSKESDPNLKAVGSKERNKMDNIPTVEAIPIKWIENYINKFMAPLYEKGEYSSNCPEARFAHNLEEMITYYLNTCED